MTTSTSPRRIEVRSPSASVCGTPRRAISHAVVALQSRPGSLINVPGNPSACARHGAVAVPQPQVASPRCNGSSRARVQAPGGNLTQQRSRRGRSLVHRLVFHGNRIGFAPRGVGARGDVEREDRVAGAIQRPAQVDGSRSRRVERREPSQARRRRVAVGASASPYAPTAPMSGSADHIVRIMAAASACDLHADHGGAPR